MTENQIYKFKIVVIGDGGVGKTSLIKKFTQGTFKKDYIKTIGAQFTKLEKEIDGDIINLIFWDIAGQDNFNFLNSLFYKDSKAAIIVYSLEENDLGIESFNHIKNWNEVLKMRSGDVPVVIFANKVDLVNEDDLEISEIQNIIDDLKFSNYYVTSAKTGQGVNDAFNMLIDLLYRRAKALS
ncbi:MAG: Rab family GTPase [Candidatus Thorarchaeota archaeon]